ncbi:helix-turn-helix domain-containing protein [Liquorilactobacillus nagelii]|uniref:helix-turn-helix domain-containing protein n=1 Tax=Liquorilactobacillus nagelii TaxID=82688 RepID=UPI001CCB725E|nr:helix-turn-helix transcriptional regulator [Liquorilactobacillus nagelii]ULQ49326.1 helix-turn-helix domain-containing protein [Liquorilactobacillus nagelii]
MTLSEKLKYCRTQKKLTQAQIAVQLNVSRKTISNWENARSFPDIASLRKLSNIYNVSLDDLLQDSHLIDANSLQKNHFNAKVIKLTYCLNIVFCILAYFEFFNFKFPHIPIIFFLLLSNLIVYTYYLFHFLSWNIFKKYLLIYIFFIYNFIHTIHFFKYLFYRNL